jgi:septum formation protein
MNRSIVLASGSPRRKALLEDLGLSIDVRVSHAEEISDGSPEEVVAHNARIKCESIAADARKNEIVIAADTIVVHEGTILGKPESLDEARAMLRRLSGDTHEVKTGVHIYDAASDRYQEGIETTSVTFRDLPDRDIDLFVDIVKPTDRAGAYTVDGPGSLIVSRYAGCYYNVLGLPLVLLHTLLLDVGFHFFDVIEPEKARFL